MSVRLLVSVSDADEAARAVSGGADIVDAKNPDAGALGAVTLETLRGIHSAIAGRRQVTAAIGDAGDEDSVERTARLYSDAGAALVKIGFAGIRDTHHVGALIAAAVRGTGGPGVVAVAYADADRVHAICADRVVEIAARTGASGVLLDTADKSTAGLFELISALALSHWVADARASGLLVALAGKLTAADIARVRDCGADIAGVRGAACVGGRTGRIDAARVALLRAQCTVSGFSRTRAAQS